MWIFYVGIVQWPTLDFAFMYLVSFTCSPQVVPSPTMVKITILLMGAPAAGLLVKLQRVVRDECNPCSCFAVPRLCIFRLWLSVNSIQAVLLKGRARKNSVLNTHFYSDFHFHPYKDRFLWSARHCEFVLMHVVPFVFQDFKLCSIFRVKRWTRALSPVQTEKFSIRFH